MQEQNLVAACHDIFVSLDGKEVAEFENIPRIGMTVRLALHLRGLPIVEYEVLRLVSSYYFNIPNVALPSILQDLEDVQFIRIISEGRTYKRIIPMIPYFDNIYSTLESNIGIETFSETEQMSLEILKRLSNSPIVKDSILDIGDKKMVDRCLDVGRQGGYILSHRARGKDILYSPVFFSQNADLYADLVAKSGAKSITRVLNLLKDSQGWPLSIIETTKEVNGVKVTDDEIRLIRRLASDGAVQPPSITTSHAGENFFMFTPQHPEKQGLTRHGVKFMRGQWRWFRLCDRDKCYPGSTPSVIRCMYSVR